VARCENREDNRPCDQSFGLNDIQPADEIEVFSVECGHVAALRSNAVAATVML